MDKNNNNKRTNGEINASFAFKTLFRKGWKGEKTRRL